MAHITKFCRNTPQIQLEQPSFFHSVHCDNLVHEAFNKGIVLIKFILQSYFLDMTSKIFAVCVVRKITSTSVDCLK